MSIRCFLGKHNYVEVGSYEATMVKSVVSRFSGLVWGERKVTGYVTLYKCSRCGAKVAWFEDSMGDKSRISVKWAERELGESNV